MTYFPMFVSLDKKPCLIVGGGKVAARKCRGLLAFGAEVTVIAGRFSGFIHLQDGGADGNQVYYDLHNPEKEEEKAPGGVHHIRRRFCESDISMQEWALVIAATDCREVNGRIAALCHERQIPVNVADCREECTFFFPAYCMEGNIAVGVTTSGENPGTASALRKRIEKVLPQWICETGKDAKENE